jgi:predicted O-methyltransferase YrrM
MKYIFLFNKNKKASEIYKNNLEFISSLERVEVIKSNNINLIMEKLREHNLIYNCMRDEIEHKYDDLGFFLTKYECLKEQVSNNIEYLCMIEDNVILSHQFMSFTTSLLYLFADPELNLIKLGKAGEGHLISLEGSKRIINLIEKNGMINQINDQLSRNCGKELNLSSLTPWKLSYDEEIFSPKLTFNKDIINNFTKNHKVLMEKERISDFVNNFNFGFVEGHFGNNNTKKNIIRELVNIYKAKKIMQIGFNAGHSAEIFLTASNDTTLVSFDINHHSYIDMCNYYINYKYNNRHRLIYGDSKFTVRQYSDFSNEKFDMILIDGDHTYETVKKDIDNCRLLSHENTIIIVNDVISKDEKLHACWTIEPTKIWKEHCNSNLINEMGYFDISSGCGFVYGKYIF